MQRILIVLLLVIPFLSSHSQGYNVEKIWETDKVFLTPESVLYDKERDVLYVSNFNKFPKANETGNEFISKLNLNGEVMDLKWIEGLTAPTGMCIFGDKLYIAERGNLVEINATTGEIIERYPVPDTKFINDLAVDENGTVYISESGNSKIYKFNGTEFEEFLSENDVSKPNGITITGDRLIIGNSGTGCVLSVNLSNKKIETLGCFESARFIDGLRTFSNDEFIISDWNGQTSVLKNSGDIIELLNTTNKKIYSADLEYITEKNLLLIPTFYDNRVVAYTINKSD